MTDRALVEPNIDLIRRYFDVRSDLSKIGDFYAEDIIWHNPHGGDLGPPVYSGKETVVAMLSKFAAVTDNTFVLTPSDILATEDFALARLDWTASRGEWSIAGSEFAVVGIANQLIAEARFFDSEPG